MRYKIRITGGEDVIATEVEKTEVLRHWKNKDGAVLAVGRSTINVNSVKTITEIDEINFTEQNKHRDSIDIDFTQAIEASLKLSTELRARREMTIRVLPAWKLSKGTRVDKEMMEVFNLAKLFFAQYPHYPYFPSRLWWSILEKKLRTNIYNSLFFQYIIRHDEQVEYWIRSKGQKKAESIQQQMSS